MSFKILNACKKIYPNAEVTIKGEDFSTIKFYNGTPTMTEDEIKAKFPEVEADEQNKINLKASAKAKLIAGEPLTQEEADTIVL
jgi:hypothetical protein